MAEQLICNQQVVGSTPITSSKESTRWTLHMGDFPSGQRGQTVNLLLFSFGGPNPPSPTKKRASLLRCSFLAFGDGVDEEHTRIAFSVSQNPR